MTIGRMTITRVYCITENCAFLEVKISLKRYKLGCMGLGWFKRFLGSPFLDKRQSMMTYRSFQVLHTECVLSEEKRKQLASY